MEMLSDGELYRMQQEAVLRARETARSAPSNPSKQKENECEKRKEPFINKLTELLNFKGNDSLLLVGVILLLIFDGCDDELLLIALIFLLLKN